MEKYSENIIINNQDVVDGEILDMTIELTGRFTIEGKSFDEFTKELDNLIEKFRI